MSIFMNAEQRMDRLAELHAAADAEERFHNSPEWKCAGRIIKHMWILAFFLPVACVILVAILK